ncbi:hypothetical protein C462_14278 [Halorubrum distributum JCM 13916]|uniref:Uncharacterized protein n=1 Tax=Halorubrum distributum JCM 13916 TaxID=1230455 RepID=M0PEA9_9EURY|nr:hypothetical protein C462_14278 [Halorubrum arcis JCM 13916]
MPASGRSEAEAARSTREGGGDRSEAEGAARLGRREVRLRLGRREVRLRLGGVGLAAGDLAALVFDPQSAIYE